MLLLDLDSSQIKKLTLNKLKNEKMSNLPSITPCK